MASTQTLITAVGDGAGDVEQDRRRCSLPCGCLGEDFNVKSDPGVSLPAGMRHAILFLESDSMAILAKVSVSFDQACKDVYLCQDNSSIYG